MKRKILAIILSILMLVSNVAVYANEPQNAVEDINVASSNETETLAETADCIDTCEPADETVLTDDATNLLNIDASLLEEETATAVNTIPAGTIPDYWVMAVSNSVIDTTQHYFQTTNAYAYSGNTSLELNYTRPDTGNAYLALTNTSVAGAQAGLYNISFKIRQSDTSAARAAFPSIVVILEQINNGAANDALKAELKYDRLKREDARTFATTNLGDGWWQYTTQTPVNVTGTITKFYFQQFDALSESPIYIDDVEVTNAGDNSCIIENSDFEEYTIINPNAKYYPVNVNAYTASHADIDENGEPVTYYEVTPTWKNPQEACSEIRLFDTTDGKNILLSSSFSTAGGAYNHYQVTGTVKDAVKQFRLEFDFGDGNVVEHHFFRKADTSTPPSSVGGWAVYVNPADFNKYYYRPVYVAQDASEKHSGKASFYAESTKSGEQMTFEMNTSITLTAGKKYMVTLWAKGSEGASFPVLMENSTGNIGTVTVSGKNWKKYSFIYNTLNKPTTGCLKFWLNNPVEELWIDDLEIYLLDENDNPVGSNLLDDDLSGFEKGVNAATPATVSNVSAKGVSRGVELSWDKVASEYKAVNVYQIIGGDEFLVAQVPTSKNGITLKNLENGNEYSYVVKAVSNNMVESAPVEVSAVPVSPATEIDEVYINNGTDKLVRGTNTFKANVYNNYQTDLLNVQLIVALFKNDGKELVSPIMVSGAQLMAEQEAPLTVDVTIPDDGEEYTVQAYVWDDVFSLNSLKAVKTLSIK